MAIPDIRGKAYCSLGKMIDAEIADSYAQGSGLIKCRGRVRLKGSYSPPQGTKVYFTVLVGGKLSRFNRELRVLSCFTHPYTLVTTVQLGCTLTYYESRSAAPDDVVFGRDDPDNSAANIPCSKRDFATIPLRASFVLQRACGAIFLPYSGISLTSVFAEDSIGFESGYVNVIDKLLVSENYAGYVDGFGVLRGINLAVASPSGPLISGNKVIRIEGINSGDLPGSAVFVRYTTKRLKAPSEEEVQNTLEGGRILNSLWEQTFFVQEAVDVYLQGETQVVDKFSYQGKSDILSTFDQFGRLETKNAITGAPFRDTVAFSRYYYKDKSTFKLPEYDECGKTKNTEWGPDIELGEIEKEFTTTTGSALDLCRRCGYTGPGGDSPVKTMITEKRAVFYSKKGDKTFVFEQVQIPYYQTPHGSLAIDKWMEDYQDAGFQEQVYEKAVSLTNYGSTQRIRSEKYFGIQSLPKEEDIKAQESSRDQEGPEVEEVEEIAWSSVLSSIDVREFVLPFPTQDIIAWTGGDNYTLIKGFARMQARSFGRTQNRLLLGNRNGINLQLTYEMMPQVPLSTIYVEANNIRGAYRVNGTSWVFSGDGIIASTDALFWGGVGTVT